jgi:Terminase RNaseH-like domain
VEGRAVSGRVHSPAKKAAAARCFREGKSLAVTSKATGIPLRTLSNWKRDPDFMMLLHSRGVLQSGPLQATASDDAAIDDVGDDSIMWLDPDANVLGTLAVRDDKGELAPMCRVVFVRNADCDEVRHALDEHRFPETQNARTAMLTSAALTTDDDERRTILRLFTAPQPQAFREWCRLWRYRAGETKDIRTLENRWEAQEILATALTTNDHNYLSKARKLGASEISICYAGFVARIRDENARVALYSYRERAARSLLAKVKFGLEGLPPYLRLGYAKETTLVELELDAGQDDVRTITSYPTNVNTSIESTNSHSMLDEFAHWPHGEETYGRLEATFTADGCTSELLTTGAGPAAWSSDYWRACKDGQGLHTPLFIPATARPDRTPEWIAAKRKTMTKSAFRREYALEESDALAGATGSYFEGEDIEFMATTNQVDGAEILRRIDAQEYKTPKKQNTLAGARFITGVDLGVKDATVVVTLAIMRNEVKHIVKFERAVGFSYPQIQRLIEDRARDFPRSVIVIEANSMGATVIGNLKIPAWQVVPFHTTATSKARLIEGIAWHLEQRMLYAHTDDCPELYSELRNYTIPDDYVSQDCVMAVGIALDQVPVVYNQGRVMGVFTVDR